jgi:hypothetical protein
MFIRQQSNIYFMQTIYNVRLKDSSFFSTSFKKRESKISISGKSLNLQ